MAHKTPKLLKIPALSVRPYCGSFLFSLYSPQYKSIKAIAGYGVMGSKPPALWQSEPANPKGFARRIPSIGCVMTHPQLLNIFPAEKMAQMSLQGDTPPDPR